MTQATSAARSPSRRNSRGENTRAKLLEAALQSFASHGFHGTSTRDIAEAASMSPTSVYVHYATKEELLFQLSLAGHQDVQTVVERAATGATDPGVQLREVSREYTAWHARRHTMARVVQYEMAAFTPQHSAQIAGVRREIQGLFERIIAAGAESDRFRLQNPPMTVLAVVSLGIDVARWYREGGAWTPEQVGEHYGELALRMVGSTSTGPPV